MGAETKHSILVFKEIRDKGIQGHQVEFCGQVTIEGNLIKGEAFTPPNYLQKLTGEIMRASDNNRLLTITTTSVHGLDVKPKKYEFKFGLTPWGALFKGDGGLYCQILPLHV